jgi:hypothetical protein
MAQEAAQAAAALRQQIQEQKETSAEDPILAHFSEPRSFAEVLERTGMDERKLRAKVDALFRSGKLERWDLPRFVRVDLSDGEKQLLLKDMMRQTPMNQRGAEALTGLTRGQVSTVLSANKHREARRLGDKKGDPWFIPPRGTGSNMEPLRLDRDQDDADRSRSHRSHHGPPDGDPPKRRSRRPTRGGT